jgi:YbbR domain-containing protein
LIRKLHKGDWKALIYCFIAAVTFWFFNAMNNNYSFDVTHPLVIHYDEEQYIPVEELPTTIRFSTTATGWDIFAKTNFINATPIELELEDFKKRRYITAARLKSVVTKQMTGIHINEVLDDTIYVSFEKLRTKKVRLQVDTKSVPLAEGYRLAGVVLVDPSEIEVTGAASAIRNLKDVVSIELNASNITGKYDKDIALSDVLKPGLKSSKEKVNVRLEAYQLERVKKTLKLEKINFPKRKKIEIDAEKAQLTYFARKEDLPIVELQSFDAIVDFNTLNEKNKTIKIRLKKVPELVQRYYFDPEEVKIKYVE